MFIRIYEKDFTKEHLLNVCKRLKMRKLSKLKKRDLATKLQVYYAQKYITHTCFKKIRKIEYVNYQDPISLMDIEYPYISLELQKGKVVRYCAINIYEYILRTGNFCDPFTGNIFSDHQIKLLDERLV